MCPCVCAEPNFAGIPPIRPTFSPETRYSLYMCTKIQNDAKCPKDPRIRALLLWRGRDRRRIEKSEDVQECSDSADISPTWIWAKPGVILLYCVNKITEICSEFDGDAENPKNSQHGLGLEILQFTAVTCNVCVNLPANAVYGYYCITIKHLLIQYMY